MHVLALEGFLCLALHRSLRQYRMRYISTYAVFQMLCVQVLMIQVVRRDSRRPSGPVGKSDSNGSISVAGGKPCIKFSDPLDICTFTYIQDSVRRSSDGLRTTTTKCSKLC